MTQTLIDLQEPDEPELGSLIALHGRPTQKVIDWCKDLCRATDPHHRVVGLRVLRELGHQLVDLTSAWEGIEPLVVELARNDQAPEVITWAISCLNYKSTSPAAFEAVLLHVEHSDPNVRFSVANALPGFTNDTDRTGAIIDILTTMADDEDADVRAYALMGLTYDLGLVEEIRPLLETHSSDADEQIALFAQKALNGEWS